MPDTPPLADRTYRHVFETAAVGIAVVGLDGSWVDVNSTICKILGYSREELLSTTFQQLTHVDDLDSELALVASLIKGSADSYDMEKRYWNKNGDLVWAKLTVGIVRDDEGAPIHFVSVIDDITLRNKAETSAREYEQRLAATFENVAVGIIMTDWNGEFVGFNRRFVEMLGYDLDSFKPGNFRDHMHPDDVTAHSPRRRDLWLGKIPSVAIDRRWIKADGSHLWSRLTISVQDSEAELEPYSVTIVEDISEERRLEKSQKLLIGELNHRVKNTLAIVQGVVRRTLQTNPEPEAFAKLIEERLQSISEAHNLLSRNDWHNLTVRQLVDACLLKPFAIYADAISCSGPDISLEAQQAITTALAFHELATNAIKHGSLSRAGGRVLVEMTEGGDSGVSAKLTWREVGGPPPVPSERSGFGSFLLRDAMPYVTGGPSKIEFDPGGLVVEFTFVRGQQS